MALLREFRLEVITPVGVAYRGAATSVVAPGTAGYLGVLAGHTPLVTSLRHGKLAFTAGGVRREFLIGEGYMEVTPASVIIIAEEVEAEGQN